jgi:hypothetical protein
MVNERSLWINHLFVSWQTQFCFIPLQPRVHQLTEDILLYSPATTCSSVDRRHFALFPCNNVFISWQGPFSFVPLQPRVHQLTDAIFFYPPATTCSSADRRHFLLSPAMFVHRIRTIVQCTTDVYKCCPSFIYVNIGASSVHTSRKQTFTNFNYTS